MARFIAILAIAIASSAAAQNLPPYPVQSGSMSPTVEAGEQVAIEVVDFERLRWGDLVIYWGDSGSGRQLAYIKRVVGLPGQRIAFRDGVLFVDGVPVEQTATEIRNVDGRSWQLFTESFGGRHYVIQQLVESPPASPRTMTEITVPPGHFFAVGDSRDNSRDSRTLGPIRATSLLARAVSIETSPDADR
ncbi:MAG TPA: signal peptidase I, partial [Vitreimonas sp.]|nr:signal peptidase I [Vitreimonas sp.]